MAGQMGRQEEALRRYRRAPAPFGYGATNLWNQSEALINLGRLPELDTVIRQMPQDWRGPRRWAEALVRRDYAEAERLQRAGQQLANRTGPLARLRNALELLPFHAVRGRVAQTRGTVGTMLAVADSLRMTGDEGNVAFATQQVIEWETFAVTLSLTTGGPMPAPRLGVNDTTGSALLIRGLAAGLRGDTDAAVDIRAALQDRRDELFAELGSSAVVIDGAIAAGQGDWAVAREALTPAREWNWPYRTFRGAHVGVASALLLAEAYEQTGAPDSAAAVYAMLQDAGQVNRIIGDPWPAPTLFPFMTFRLARMQTQLGQLEEARASWLTFLDVFTDPDADLQWMVDEANETLARLAAEGAS
jgi:hypothetical protein